MLYIYKTRCSSFLLILYAHTIIQAVRRHPKSPPSVFGRGTCIRKKTLHNGMYTLLDWPQNFFAKPFGDLSLSHKRRSAMNGHRFSNKPRKQKKQKMCDVIIFFFELDRLYIWQSISENSLFANFLHITWLISYFLNLQMRAISIKRSIVLVNLSHVKAHLVFVWQLRFWCLWCVGRRCYVLSLEIGYVITSWEMFTLW